MLVRQHVRAEKSGDDGIVLAGGAMDADQQSRPYLVNVTFGMLRSRCAAAARNDHSIPFQVQRPDVRFRPPMQRCRPVWNVKPA